MRLDKKIALVTGASGSIGQAVCRRFKEEGASVVGVDRVKPSVADLNLQCDLSDVDALNAIAKAVDGSVGEPDIVVHCAAMSDLACTADVDAETFTKVMSTNVYSAMQLAQCFAPAMCRRQQGVFIFVSSITGLVGAPGMAAYAASKGALHTATRTLALELADCQVRVNSVSPASVDTPMLRDKFNSQPDPQEALEKNIRRHPLGRLGTPEDIANLALFLCSDEASWITGSDYVIDGGASIARR